MNSTPPEPQVYVPSNFGDYSGQLQFSNASFAHLGYPWDSMLTHEAVGAATHNATSSAPEWQDHASRFTGLPSGSFHSTPVLNEELAFFNPIYQSPGENECAAKYQLYEQSVGGTQPAHPSQVPNSGFLQANTIAGPLPVRTRLGGAASIGTGSQQFEQTLGHHPTPWSQEWQGLVPQVTDSTSGSLSPRSDFYSKSASSNSSYQPRDDYGSALGHQGHEGNIGPTQPPYLLQNPDFLQANAITGSMRTRLGAAVPVDTRSQYHERTLRHNPTTSAQGCQGLSPPNTDFTFESLSPRSDLSAAEFDFSNSIYQSPDENGCGSGYQPFEGTVRTTRPAYLSQAPDMGLGYADLIAGFFADRAKTAALRDNGSERHTSHGRMSALNGVRKHRKPPPSERFLAGRQLEHAIEFYEHEKVFGVYNTTDGISRSSSAGVTDPRPSVDSTASGYQDTVGSIDASSNRQEGDENATSRNDKVIEAANKVLAQALSIDRLLPIPGTFAGVLPDGHVSRKKSYWKFVPNSSHLATATSIENILHYWEDVLPAVLPQKPSQALYRSIGAFKSKNVLGRWTPSGPNAPKTGVIDGDTGGLQGSDLSARLALVGIRQRRATKQAKKAGELLESLASWLKSAQESSWQGTQQAEELTEEVLQRAAVAFDELASRAEKLYPWL